VSWKKKSVVDERRAFIAEWLKRKEAFAELCDKYGVSRKTGYKWTQRFYEGGVSGLLDRSRRPHRLARAVSEETAQALVELRERYPTWGPKKLRAWCVERAPERHWPALSTIGELLKRRGLVQERKRRVRTPHPTQPLAAATEPNTIWTADFKGAYRVAFLRGVRDILPEARCEKSVITDRGLAQLIGGVVLGWVFGCKPKIIGAFLGLFRIFIGGSVYFLSEGSF
jgi:transposase